MEERCPHCGASLKSYWHKITPGLMGTLVKVYKRISEKQENRIHKNELILSHSEYGNFQKLRFHALIAKIKQGGVWKSGEWLITRRGAQFLRGEINIPVKVKTFRNRVVGHSEDMIDVKGAISTTPIFETEFQFDFMDLPENGDFDEGPVIKKKVGRKKKNACPECGGRTVTGVDTAPSDKENTLSIVARWRKCTKCGYKENIEDRKGGV